MARAERSTFGGELLAGQDPKTILQPDGPLGELKKALAERMLNAELDVHLGQEAEQDAGTTATARARRRY